MVKDSPDLGSQEKICIDLSDHIREGYLSMGEIDGLVDSLTPGVKARFFLRLTNPLFLKANLCWSDDSDIRLLLIIRKIKPFLNEEVISEIEQTFFLGAQLRARLNQKW